MLEYLTDKLANSSISNLFSSSAEQPPIINYYLQGLVLSWVIFLFYLELNPKIGGIFFRPDSTGEMRFRLGGVVPMLYYPFQSINFWYPWNWDLNFLVFTNLGAGVYTLLKYLKS